MVFICAVACRWCRTEALALTTSETIFNASSRKEPTHPAVKIELLHLLPIAIKIKRSKNSITNRPREIIVENETKQTRNRQREREKKDNTFCKGKSVFYMIININTAHNEHPT